MNIPALRRFLEEVIPQHRAVEGYEVEHEFPTVESGQAVSLGLVTTELVINALKHAFPRVTRGRS